MIFRPAINWFEYIAIKGKLFKQTWWYFHGIFLFIITYHHHHHHSLTTTLVPETWTNGLSVNKSWRAWPNSWNMVWIYHSLILLFLLISYCVIQNNSFIIWPSKWQMWNNHSLFFIHSFIHSFIQSINHSFILLQWDAGLDHEYLHSDYKSYTLHWKPVWRDVHINQDTNHPSNPINNHSPQ